MASSSSYNHGGHAAPSSVTSRDDVRAIQRQLNAQGANLKVDGLWGAKTEAAYRASGLGNTSGSSSGSSSRSTGRSSGRSSRSTTYGNGSYGGKYLGSRQTNAYQNMENAPGSTGYERGSLTLRVPRKDEEGEIYYEDVTREGVLPLGTSFRATGAALADAANAPDSSGIFAYAKGRTPGYIEHASGYRGMGYQDAKGNFYDANGNFIREDNFYYEPGAQISKNGMYQDTGSGMGHAGYGLWGTPDSHVAVRGSKYGAAPGTKVGFFGAGSGESQARQEEAPAQQTVIQQIVQAAAKKAEDVERERKMKDWAASGGVAAW